MIFKRIENIKYICNNKRLESTYYSRTIFVSRFKKPDNRHYQICFNNGSYFEFNYVFFEWQNSHIIIFKNDKGGMLHITISKK